MRDTIFAVKLIFGWLMLVSVVSHFAAAFLGESVGRIVHKVLLAVDAVALVVIVKYLYF